MLRLFGIFVRLAFGLQIAVIMIVSIGIALVAEAVSSKQARKSRSRARAQPASHAGALPPSLPGAVGIIVTPAHSPRE